MNIFQYPSYFVNIFQFKVLENKIFSDKKLATTTI